MVVVSLKLLQWIRWFQFSGLLGNSDNQLGYRIIGYKALQNAWSPIGNYRACLYWVWHSSLQGWGLVFVFPETVSMLKAKLSYLHFYMPHCIIMLAVLCTVCTQQIELGLTRQHKGEGRGLGPAHLEGPRVESAFGTGGSVPHISPRSHPVRHLEHYNAQYDRSAIWSDYSLYFTYINNNTSNVISNIHTNSMSTFTN